MTALALDTMPHDSLTASAILTINLRAIQHNFTMLQRHVRQSCEIAPVIKTNAYGLGMIPVAKALRDKGAKRFFVATIEEALALRQSDALSTIHVLNGLWEKAMPEAVAARLTPVLTSKEQIAAWRQHTLQQETPLPCWIQVDTGMKRLGMPLSEATDIAEHMAQYAGLLIGGVMSHLASAYQTDNPYNEEQRLAFQQACKLFPQTPASFANSGALLLGTPYFYDIARVGRFLYGSVNGAGTLKEAIKPVVTLRGRLLQIQDVPKGATIGYDQTFTAPHKMRLATASLGYGDGYFQSISNKGYAKIATFKAPVVGRVSMDLTTLDVTAIPEAVLAQAEWATFLDDTLTIDKLASWAHTNVWEILTHLGKRALFQHTA